jgi:hypothetical protein
MKKIKSTQSLVMVTYEFGAPLYIAPLDKTLTPQITDKISEATIWSEFDGQGKLNYHCAITGYKKLE